MTATTSPMIVSFVIPALNEERHLGRLLTSIQQQQPTNEVERIEIIVVDNQSTDRTAQVAKDAGCRVLEVEPGRVAKARNRGAKHSVGELLAFVDADCELPPEWLAHCLQYFQDEGTSAVGSAMAPPEANAPWVETVWYELAHRNSRQDVENVDWLPTFNLLVRRSAFEAVGGFDERLITCEDTDLGYKLSAQGRVLLEHSVRTQHLGESKSLKEFFRREAWRGRGSWRSLGAHWSLAELRSVLIPLAFAGAVVLGVLLLVCGFVVDRQPAWLDLRVAGAGSLVIGLLAPLFIALQKGTGGHWLQAWIMMAAYLTARAFGLFWPMPRVQR